MKELFTKVRRVKVIVRGIEIEFDEMYCVNEFDEEIYNRDIEIQNDIKVYDLYKSLRGLLTSYEIKELRNKYSLSQKDFSILLGLGEVTINRIERGSIQTTSIDNIIRTAGVLSEMEKLLIRNGNKISNEVYNVTIKHIHDLKSKQKHKVAVFDFEELKALDFRTEKLFDVCFEIIRKYNMMVDKKFSTFLNGSEVTKEEVKMNYITNLLLQKMLYFVQGLSGCLYETEAFTETIVAWAYGPVVPEAYHYFKTNGSSPILFSDADSIELSKGVDKIIDVVVEYYGTFNAASLIDFTHEEDPWKTTPINSVIEFEKLICYFSSVYLS